MMDLSWNRKTPGPIVHHYRNPRSSVGIVLSICKDIWLLSFGVFGHALAIGWVAKKPRFGHVTYRFERR